MIRFQQSSKLKSNRYSDACDGQNSYTPLPENVEITSNVVSKAEATDVTLSAASMYRSPDLEHFTTA